MPRRADKVTLSADPTNWNINLPPNHGLYLPLIDNLNLCGIYIYLCGNIPISEEYPPHEMMANLRDCTEIDQLPQR